MDMCHVGSLVVIQYNVAWAGGRRLEVVGVVDCWYNKVREEWVAGRVTFVDIGCDTGAEKGLVVV